MREIKFRAWYEKEKILGIVQFLDFEFKKVTFLINDGSYRDNIDLEKVKLMQYIGLKDKNGKEIYEGDIIRHTRIYNGGKDTSDFYPLVIKFKEDVASFVIDYGCCGYCQLTEFDASANVEIIGNIYENQEL